MGKHTHLRLVSEELDPHCGASAGSQEGLMIDCDMCVMQHTETCDDCVVSYLVGHAEGTPVVLDFEERRAFELLNDAGLVPSSRFIPRSSAV
ncbi:MAG: hypothetical protein OXN44_11585 [Acidimicrobiaceae bacterium]|nr:hypothetical protein [Acidimicrobiaceae bacterium]MDE0606184.1 hypothetical protein [Acidimicrobiaceae bacterium]